MQFMSRLALLVTCTVAQAAERQMALQTSESATNEAAEDSSRSKPKVSSASNIDRSKEQCEKESSSSTEELSRRGLGGKPASQSLRYHKTSAYSPLEAARNPNGQAALQKASQLAREHPSLHSGSSLEPPLPAGGSGHNIAAEPTPLTTGAVGGESSAPSRPPMQRSFPSNESLQKNKVDAARTASGLSAPVSTSESRRASATGSASLSRQGSGMRKASTTTSLEKQGADEPDQAPNFKVRLF